MPNIVTRRLHETRKAGIHPDPDLMAAFVERSLNPREQNAILEHLAHCADCREVVALSLPEQLDAAAASSLVPARSAWLSWPVLRWGAVAACVVVVGAAVTLHYQSIKPARPSITASDAPLVQMPAAAQPMQPDAVRPSSAGTAQVVTPPAAQSPGPPSAHATTATGSGLAHIASNGGGQSEAKRAGATENRETVEVTGSAPLLANPEATAENAQLVPGRAKDESEPSATVKMKMSPAAGMAQKQMTASSAMIARAATIPANVTPRWTLTSEGMLQRSIDSGKTWETILVASPGSFRALTANGFDIWVGGAKGALYHSIDAGQHWMRVQPMAAGESLTADIIGIEFTDLLHGSLTTADKQTWITADAGATWQKQ